MRKQDMRDRVRALLAAHGRTYAAEAGIRLADTPAPLYRLLVLTVLQSNRIAADLAVAAAAELVRSGYGTARAMREATWQQRVDALGRAHYRRYDELTATALGDGAQLLIEEYRGDLRRLRAAADGDADAIRQRLTAVPRIGPTGAGIFCREAQAVWPELRPAIDRKALQGAEKLGLPADAGALAQLVGGDELAPFSAALVRVALRPKLAGDFLAAH